MKKYVQNRVSQLKITRKTQYFRDSVFTNYFYIQLAQKYIHSEPHQDLYLARCLTRIFLLQTST